MNGCVCVSGFANVPKRQCAAGERRRQNKTVFDYLFSALDILFPGYCLLPCLPCFPSVVPTTSCVDHDGPAAEEEAAEAAEE